MFQHVAYELLGTLHPLLKKAKFRIRYANFGRLPNLTVDMSRYDGLIILGGPMGVYEAKAHPHLTHELECIEEAIRTDKPVLGICLGAQLVAAALGAEVKPSEKKEIGWYDVSLTKDGKKDPLLGELEEKEKIFQWHGDTFAIPKGAEWLAKSEACPHQAFRYGDKVYGFQFHLEVDEPMIERWLAVPYNRDQLKGFAGPDAILADTHQYIARQKQLGKKVFSHYIERFSTKKPKKLVLGHK